MNFFEKISKKIFKKEKETSSLKNPSIHEYGIETNFGYYCENSKNKLTKDKDKATKLTKYEAQYIMERFTLLLCMNKSDCVIANIVKLK